MSIRIIILCLSLGISLELPAQNILKGIPDSKFRSPENIPCYKPAYAENILSNFPVNFFQSHYSRKGQRQALSNLIATDSTYEFTSPLDSVPVMKREQRYSEDAALLLLKEFRWDSGISGWTPNRKQVHNYDITGNEKFLFTFEWNDDLSQWIKDAKDSLVYDDKNTHIDYYMEWVENEWIIVRKFIQQWDDLKRYILYAHYDFDTLSNEWQGCCKNEYYYDEEENMNLELQYSWDRDQKDFILWGREESAYNATGEVTERIRYLLDEGSGEWVNWEKREFSNRSEMGHTMDYFLWDLILQQWILKNTSDYFFDTSGNFLGMESFDYDQDSEVPVSGFKFWNTLNEEGLLMVLTNYQWDVAKKEWYVIRKNFHQYENPLITYLPPPNNEEFKIYPNPADSYIFISGSPESGQVSVKIYTIEGNLIFDKSCENEMADISWLSPGLYLLQLNRPRGKPIIKQLFKK